MGKYRSAKETYRAVMLIAVMVMLIAVPSSVDASGYKTGYVSSQTPIKMYKKASVKSKVVRKLAHNKEIQYKYYKRGWYLAKRGNKTGFVRSKYISKYKTAKENRPVYSPGYFRQMGVIYWGSWRWTWYSSW